MLARWTEAARLRLAETRTLDGVLVVVGLGLTVLAVRGSWSPVSGWAIATSGLVASFALWWRHRWPLTVTAIAAVAYVLSGNPWPLLVGLYTAAAAARNWQWLTLGLTGTLGFAGLSWFEARDVAVDGLAGVVLLVGGALALGAYASTRRELVRSLRERAERTEAERLLRIEQAKTGERTRIAREMHDVLAHKVTLIALHAGALEVNPPGDPTKVRESAALISATARSALDELRSVLGLLRPPADAPASEALRDQFTDLGQLVASWEQAGVRIDLRNHAGALPATTGRAVYRLVQEGLTNASKHAPGAAVIVKVTGGNGLEVLVEVVNGPPDQRARVQLAGAGAGLIGLGERLRLIGGTLTSEPDASGGWRLEGRFPWIVNAAEAVGKGRDEEWVP
jgi:signal transduction histidine kinase